MTTWALTRISVNTSTMIFLHADYALCIHIFIYGNYIYEGKTWNSLNEFKIPLSAIIEVKPPLLMIFILIIPLFHLSLYPFNPKYITASTV